MWIFSGAIAIIMAIINIYRYIKRKPTKWFRFLSLAMMAFTVCFFYGDVSKWANAGDWSAIIDVVPVMAKALWILVVSSVFINGISLFEK